MAKCFSDLSKIVESCYVRDANGYTGRVWVFPSSVYMRFSEGNRNVITQIKANSDVDAGNVDPNDVHCYDVALVEPLTGTTIAGNTDSGRHMFQKTVTLRIPVRDADAVESVLMPLVDNRSGWVIVAETKSSDVNSGYRVFGAYDRCVADVAGITQNEYENGGDWVVPFVCIEPVSDVVFKPTDYIFKKEIKAWLDGLCK